MEPIPFLSILIVDDQPVVTDWILEYIQIRWRAKLFVVHQADHALEILIKMKLDLLVTDYQMPGMDGIELCHAIRTRKILLPILMMTGHYDQDFNHKIKIITPPFCWISKPIDPCAMMEKMMALLENKTFLFSKKSLRS